MKKIDIAQKGMKISKIDFDIYAKINGSNLVRLNKSKCEDTRVTLSVPITLTESIDKLNSSSGYYNDICYKAKSNSGTDISLSDRKIEFISENKTVCQENCHFSDYNYESEKANCSCKIKDSSSSIDNININKTKLYENFIGTDDSEENDIITTIEKQKSSSNIKVTSCNVFESTENLISNTAFFILLFIFSLFIIIFIIFFYICFYFF